MRQSMDPVVLCTRAFLLASVAVFLGVAGHVSADGLLPGPAVLVVLVAVAAVLSLGLLRRPAGPVRIVALLVGGQTAIHLALTLTAGHVGDAVARAAPAATVPGTLSLPVDHGRRIGSLQDSYEAAAGARGLAPSLPIGHLVSDLSAHAPMMLVHLLAAVGVGLWLAVGERSLWTLLALLGAVAVRLLLPLVLHPVLTPARPRPRADVVRRVARPLLLLARSVTRRGPPVFLAA